MATFDTPQPISATVDIILGNIRFVAGDRADTVVEVRPVDPSWELDVKAAEQAKITFTDGKLQVRHPKLRTAFAKRYGRVEVLVELPAGSNVQGATAKGDYLVSGVVGSCHLKTATGDIRVEQASGVRLKTSGGRVTVDHVTGRADVNGNGEIRVRRVGGDAVVKNISGDSRLGEVGGDLRVNSANGGISVDVAHAAVHAKTASGDIRVGEVGSGQVELYTPNGEVELGVPRGTAVLLDANTSAGRVRNQVEAGRASDASDRSGQSIKVRARSHGGDIIVRPA
ncbi:DUF4097 family beta strand repeat-containing protein [Flindersiella endophytica]